MKIENDYPQIKKYVNKFVLFRKIILICFLISTLICTIVNIAVGGKKWFLLVIGAEVIFYYAFLNKPLIENNFIKRFTLVIFIICAYLYLIDIINKTNWSYFVIGILLFSIIIIQLFLFVLKYKDQNKKFIPMFFTSVGSIIFCILAITSVFKINWPIIVFGSLGVSALLVMFLFYRKTIINDLKKYFSTK